MHPVLKVGDWVTLEPVGSQESLKRFDLIVFKRADRVVCHYLWRINQQLLPGTLVTRSLRSPHHDEFPVSFADILGRVTQKRIPAWTRAVLILRTLLRGTT
ncbi:MAG: hypothetical protein A2070_06450 [Bdellovibrionales bacterium GWC1_52_8]|nr:MAG: hypothetical protein A2070_06450 [Bdellovibrionales bacterium GWC1_52_8]